jgi:Geranylgeranyl pyrophosphate synthase
MDKADVRRGKATVHKKWNENTAILSGDGMQIVAYQYISEVETTKLKSVLDVFSQTAIEVCEGQQYDMDFESRDIITVDEYFEMIRLKTAVLLGGALKIGALIGGAKEEDAQLLYDFGIGIGLAFQLKDDLLDTYGDEKTFGKKIGNDILCNKKTFLLTSALEKASNEKRTELQACLQISAEQAEKKIQSIIAIYNDLNVKAMCEEQINKFYLLAIEHLDKVQVEDFRKQELKLLAERLMFRED